MKHIEDTPWWICDPEETNYCAYSDTDSIYMHAEPLLRHRHSNFNEMGIREKDDALGVIAEEYEGIVTKSYKKLAADVFRADKHRLNMKTECVIRSAYFRATRRYAQWITKQDGVPIKKKANKKEKDEVYENISGTKIRDGKIPLYQPDKDNPMNDGIIDVKGLEFKKANFPPILGKFMKDALVDVLKGAPQSKIDDYLKKFKKEILDGTIPLTKLGNPQAVKKLKKYTGRKARAGEMFSVMEKGAPAAVKATVVYNDLLRFWGLHKNHASIAQGDKVKWIYLKQNPYHVDAIAFLEWDLPEKMRTFIEQYADRKKIFESILLNKLEGFYSDLGWTLNLNPYQQMFFNL